MELMNTRMLGRCSGLARFMDLVLMGAIIWHKPAEAVRTVFVSTQLKHRMIVQFMQLLPTLPGPITLVIAGGDYTFPNSTDRRMPQRARITWMMKGVVFHPKISRVYVENLDQALPKTVPIPLGINPEECPPSLAYFLPYVKLDPTKPCLVSNFNRIRDGPHFWQFNERRYVDMLCRTHWPNLTVSRQTTSHVEFLKEMGRYMFTLCVHGGGLDVNPKCWEALLIGVIPIIRENRPYTDLYLDLPVVIVPTWDERTLSRENLLSWKAKYAQFLDPATRHTMLERLTLRYWVNYIKTSQGTPVCN